MRIKPKMILEEPYCLVAQFIDIFAVTLFSDVLLKLFLIPLVDVAISVYCHF